MENNKDLKLYDNIKNIPDDFIEHKKFKNFKNIENLPKNVLLQLALECNLSDLLNFCRISKK